MAAWLRAMFGFFVLSAMLLVPVHGADATFPGSNGKIAFSPSFYNEVLTIDPDGTHLRRLAFGRHPNWASDGSLIVYTGDINHPDQLLIMNADGSGKRVLLRGAFPSSAAFAPGAQPSLQLPPPGALGTSAASFRRPKIGASASFPNRPPPSGC